MIATNLGLIKKRIEAAAKRSGRQPGEISLLAVSKHVDADRIRQAYAAGQRVFGENYVQEAQDKIVELSPDIMWHFIGHLQSNKVKLVINLFDVIETVDRLKLARCLENHLSISDRTLDVFIQVNVGREEQKGGVLPENLEELAVFLNECAHIKVRGLMTMPPYFEDPEKTRPFFRELRVLSEKLLSQNILGKHGRVELSMGMSGDFEVAVEEGATLVRVGTALFGKRTY